MDLLSKISGSSLKSNFPEFSVGDTVKVDVEIKEGERKRIQAFEGTVLAKKGTGVVETFTVRKVSYGCGVERIFPVHSPSVKDVKIIHSPDELEEYIENLSLTGFGGTDFRPVFQYVDEIYNSSKKEYTQEENLAVLLKILIL